MAKRVANSPLTNWDYEDPDAWESLGTLKEGLEDIITNGHYTHDMPSLQRMSHHYMFVYGSLKKNFHNHKMIMGYDCIGCGFTDQDKFALVNYTRGGFPVMLFNPNKQTQARVYGEIYEMDAEGIRSLDFLEANGYMYKRMPMMINYYDKAGNLKSCCCWTYLGIRDFWAKRRDLLKQMKRYEPNNGDSPYYLFSKVD